VPRGQLQGVLDSERFNLLRTLDFFKGFGDVELWEVVHRARWQRLPFGHAIYRKGEEGDTSTSWPGRASRSSATASVVVQLRARSAYLAAPHGGRDGLPGAQPRRGTCDEPSSTCWCVHRARGRRTRGASSVHAAAARRSLSACTASCRCAEPRATSGIALRLHPPPHECLVRCLAARRPARPFGRGNSRQAGRIRGRCILQEVRGDMKGDAAFMPCLSCEGQGQDKNGKTLAGAAKTSFMKKCEADAQGRSKPSSSCEPRPRAP
jgi:hypothetical protein